jgi:hypothetical protein
MNARKKKRVMPTIDHGDGVPHHTRHVRIEVSELGSIPGAIPPLDRSPVVADAAAHRSDHIRRQRRNN